MSHLTEVRTLGESDFAETQPQVPVVVSRPLQQVMRHVVEHVIREQPKLSLAELRTMDLAQQMAWRWLRRAADAACAAA